MKTIEILCTATLKNKHFEGKERFLLLANPTLIRTNVDQSPRSTRVASVKGHALERENKSGSKGRVYIKASLLAGPRKERERKWRQAETHRIDVPPGTRAEGRIVRLTLFHAPSVLIIEIGAEWPSGICSVMDSVLKFGDDGGWVWNFNESWMTRFWWEIILEMGRDYNL